MSNSAEAALALAEVFFHAISPDYKKRMTEFEWAYSSKNFNVEAKTIYQRFGLDILTHALNVRVLLHVGCGHTTIANIPLAGFKHPSWREIRLDANEHVAPDLIGSMVHMTAVPDGLVDAVYTSHDMGHLYWHEVPLALADFYRALKADGFFVITCPDVQDAAQLAASAGWLSHHCGFTLATLMNALHEAGFAVVHGARRPDAHDLWVLASKSPRTPDTMAALAQDYLLPIQESPPEAQKAVQQENPSP